MNKLPTPHERTRRFIEEEFQKFMARFFPSYAGDEVATGKCRRLFLGGLLSHKLLENRGLREFQVREQAALYLHELIGSPTMVQMDVRKPKDENEKPPPVDQSPSS